jgi:hypothetical protein
MKKIITVGILSMLILSAPISVFAAKYKSAVSGRYTKSSYAKSHTSTTYKTRR